MSSAPGTVIISDELGVEEYLLVSRSRGTLVVGDDRPTVLLFLPGFLASPLHYRVFLTEIAGQSASVIAPRLHRLRISALRGEPTPRQEAATAVGLIDQIRSSPNPKKLWIGGHSRGGQVAWLAANSLAAKGVSCDGVIAVDPVDGSGPQSPEPNATTDKARFTAPTLIIGAGVGTRCAPPRLNHEVFAGCAPPETEYVVFPDLGHADVMTGLAGALGRALCATGPEPAAQRKAVAEHISRFLARH